jgi:hypothetical protein
MRKEERGARGTERGERGSGEEREEQREGLQVSAAILLHWGGPDVIRKEAWPFCRPSSGVRLPPTLTVWANRKNGSNNPLEGRRIPTASKGMWCF